MSPAHGTAAAHSHHDHEHHHEDVVYPEALPFVLVHLVCFAAIWSGVTWPAIWIGVALYFVRMWALTAGFHRYFSHRSYKTSRVFQFIMAFLGQTSAQRGVIWWSATHRHHHRHSDTPHDVHSPAQHGFLFSHMGWIFSRRRDIADYETVRDLTRFPELVFLDRHPYFPAFLLALGCYLVAGWPGLVVGFFWSTVVLYHCVFFINSLAHVHGKRRYATGDQSRNNWWLALITLGEGWHNNHHAYQSATRQGFRWWEVDISYYVLWLMSRVGLVWDLRAPPEAVVSGRQRLGARVVEKVARELAGSVPIERLVQQVRDAWAHKPTLDELKARVERARAAASVAAGELMTDVQQNRVPDLKRRADEARAYLREALSELHLPALPSVEDLERRAREMFDDTPSLDEIAERARELLIDAAVDRLIGGMEPAFG